MESSAARTVIEFGRTKMVSVAGDPLDQAVEAVIVPANKRGIMSSIGLLSIRTAAGSEVERELMSQAPFDIGRAVATSGGHLAARGMHILIHGVIAAEPSGDIRLHDVRRAIGASLGLAHQRKVESLAMPLLGLEANAAEDRRLAWILSIVEECVAAIRRYPPGFDTIVIASRYEDDRHRVDDALHNARTHQWRT
jgi:O-acetyl-ADP-ribose deacetylase (regulator of RNase III)